MKTREEAEEKSVEMVLSSLPDHPKSYIEGFRDCFDWLNEAEQSEPRELTSNDFIKVPSETECEGCYFVNRDHCQNDDLACEVWQDLNTCGTIDEGYIFKLKEAKQ